MCFPRVPVCFTLDDPAGRTRQDDHHPGRPFQPPQGVGQLFPGDMFRAVPPHHNVVRIGPGPIPNVAANDRIEFLFGLVPQPQSLKIPWPNFDDIDSASGPVKDINHFHSLHIRPDIQRRFVSRDVGDGPQQLVLPGLDGMFHRLTSVNFPNSGVFVVLKFPSAAWRLTIAR